MELTRKQFEKIEHLMPVQRKKSTISNYDFVCALLYIIENGCKWRALPKEFGDWHTIYADLIVGQKTEQLIVFLKDFKTKI